MGRGGEQVWGVWGEGDVSAGCRGLGRQGVRGKGVREAIGGGVRDTGDEWDGSSGGGRGRWVTEGRGQRGGGGKRDREGVAKEEKRETGRGTRGEGRERQGGAARGGREERQGGASCGGGGRGGR